ncbi:MAG: hypothetical protein RLY93_01805 [Sumerlaeia bacterium]
MPTTLPPTSPLLRLAANVAAVPVLRQSAPLASEVRRAVVQYQPTALIVDLPQVIGQEICLAVEQLPRIHMIAWRLRGTRAARAVCTDPSDPRIEAIRLALEHGLRVHFVDVAEAGEGTALPRVPDDCAAEGLGAAAFAALYWAAARPEITKRHRILAGRIGRLAARQPDQRYLVVAGLDESAALRHLFAQGAPETQPGAEEPVLLDIESQPLLHEHLPLVLGEIPFAVHLMEQWRAQASPEEPYPMDLILTGLLNIAAEQYRDEYDEEVSLTEWRTLSQFARNLAIERGRLRPGLYELVTAAKGCVDDDFGAIVLELASRYPANEQDDDDPAAHDPSRHRSLNLYVDFGDGFSRADPAYPLYPVSETTFSFRHRRPNQTQRRQWQEEFADSFFFGGGICSWPPEDERIEAFFTHLRKRALAQIGDAHTIVEEARGSLQDGLDMRETARNWHKKKLYVRRERRPPGAVGPVALIWHDFPLATPDLWRTTLYAENSNESDIAIFCAPLGQEMAGPQISRTEYHGILSVFPARGIPDVWSAAALYPWGTCARVLIAAGIYLCTEKFMAIVAPEPPDGELKALARERGVGLIYIPLSSFSRKTLKRLRTVHILASHQARSWARDYIEG